MALWCSGYGHWLDLSACAKALLALAANANVTMLLTLLTEDLKTEDLITKFRRRYILLWYLLKAEVGGRYINT